jgi:hypothetical protein
MIDMTYEQIVKAVHELRPEQKAALVQTIEMDSWLGGDVTRSQLIAESEALRAVGAFERVDSLRNRFASRALTYVTDHQLLSAIHEASVEWETDLEELADLVVVDEEG